jgi:hypothetical protein
VPAAQRRARQRTAMLSSAPLCSAARAQQRIVALSSAAPCSAAHRCASSAAPCSATHRYAQQRTVVLSGACSATHRCTQQRSAVLSSEPPCVPLRGRTVLRARPPVCCRVTTPAHAQREAPFHLQAACYGSHNKDGVHLICTRRTAQSRTHRTRQYSRPRHGAYPSAACKPNAVRLHETTLKPRIITASMRQRAAHAARPRLALVLASSVD